jgi:hypothetical protein
LNADVRINLSSLVFKEWTLEQKTHTSKTTEVWHNIGTMSTMAVSQSYAGKPSRFVLSNRKAGRKAGTHIATIT